MAVCLGNYSNQKCAAACFRLVTACILPIVLKQKMKHMPLIFYILVSILLQIRKKSDETCCRVFENANDFCLVLKRNYAKV